MKIKSFIYLAPRVAGILFILFLMLFSLDVFQPGLTAQQIAIGLFMHNIPAFVLLVIIMISWKYEIIGGVTFIFAGLLYISMLVLNSRLEWYMISWSLLIAGPAFLIGFLYILNWQKKRDSKDILEK